MNHASRATVSLLVHVGAALAVLLALEPVLRASDSPPDAIATARGLILLVVLATALAIWALPPQHRRHR